MSCKRLRVKTVGSLIFFSTVLLLGGPAVFNEPSALSWCRAMSGYASYDARNRADQTALKNLGYYKGRVDGQVGPITREAIRSFRRQNGLPPGNTLDDVSRPFLNSSRAKRMPDRSAELRAIREENMKDQTKLQRLGYYTGKVDGEQGPKTQAAIAEFRKAHGLEPGTRLSAQAREVLHGDTALSKSASVSRESASVIQEDQKALADLQYYDGAVDGVLGPKTREGILAFKRNNGFDARYPRLDNSARATLREAQAEIKWMREVSGDGVSIAMASPSKGAYRLRTANGEFLQQVDGAVKVQSAIDKMLSSGKVQKVYVDVSSLSARELESFKTTLRMHSSVRFISAESRQLLFSRTVEVVGSSPPTRLPTGFWKSTLDLSTPQTVSSKVHILGRTKELASKFVRQLREIYAGKQGPRPTLGGALNRVKEHLKKTRDIEGDEELRMVIEKKLQGIEVVLITPQSSTRES